MADTNDIEASGDASMEGEPVRMSPEDFATFTSIIDQPGKPVPELVAVLRRHAPWDKA